MCVLFHVQTELCPFSFQFVRIRTFSLCNIQEMAYDTVCLTIFFVIFSFLESKQKDKQVSCGDLGVIKNNFF